MYLQADGKPLSSSAVSNKQGLPVCIQVDGRAPGAVPWEHKQLLLVCPEERQPRHGVFAGRGSSLCTGVRAEPGQRPCHCGAVWYTAVPRVSVQIPGEQEMGLCWVSGCCASEAWACVLGADRTLCLSPYLPR